MDEQEKFIDIVTKIVMSTLKQNDLLNGEWHFGTVDTVESPSKLKVFIDNSTTSQLVNCNPDLIFESGDEVFILYVNHNSQDRYVPFKRTVGVDTDVASHDIPSGGIIMWSGSTSNIPHGWALCNGSNNTPDLRGKFVVGANPNDSDYTVGKTGGQETVTLTEGQMPRHNHTLADNSHTHTATNSVSTTTNVPRNKTYTVSTASGDTTIYALDQSSVYGIGYGFHGHTTTVNTTIQSDSHTHTVYDSGSSLSHENRPPYYALAYIMKL